MFNLIMGYFDPATAEAKMELDRVFEHTDKELVPQFQENGQPSFERLAALPCLLMGEGREDETVRVGSIIRPRVVGRHVHFAYALDPDVPPLTNHTVFRDRMRLDMTSEWEFQRTHWAVKNVDLFRFLLRNVRPRRQQPSVFKIAEHEAIDLHLLSVMMPFDAGFANVYGVIQEAAKNCGMRSARVDQIWEAAGIIQDVASLIDRARIVVCDCTNRNPNVFYEAGIAHALGREVILITQNKADIPFDLQHIRYYQYYPNQEGLQSLREALEGRIFTILSR